MCSEDLPYKMLFNYAHDALIVFKPEGEIILDVNKKAEETYGYSRDEMIGMSIEMLTKDISKGKRHINDTLNKGYQHEFESIQFDKNGNEIYFKITGSVIEYNNEKVILSINRDITEKKEAEMSLKQEHKTLKAILNNQSIYVLKTDMQGNYTYVNDYFCERLSIDRADTIGKSGMIHIIPEDHEKCIQIVEKCIAHPNQPFEVTLRKPSPNGGVFNTEWNFTAVAGDDGVPYEIITVGYDITDYEKGKIKLSALAQHSTNALIFTGNNNIIEYTNPTFNSLFWNKGEVVGKDLYEVFPQDDLSKIKEICVTIDGKQRYFTVRHSKIKNFNRTTGKLYSLSDITPLKLEQEFVKRSNHAILELSTQCILKDLSLDDYCNKLLKSAQELFNVDSCSFWKIDFKSKRMTCVHSSQKESKASRLVTTIAFEQAPGYFKSIINDKILAVDDTGLDERTQPFLEEYIGQYNVRALLDVQVVGEESIIGILRMESSSPRKWTHEEKALATNFSILIDTAFANHKIQQAREEIAKLSLVASKTHNGVIITDADGYTTWINEAFTNLCGCDPQDIIGKKPGHVLQGKETDPVHVENIRKALRKREPINQEILNYKVSGEPYWVDLSISPVFNKEGKLVQFIGIQNDITERKNVQHALEHSESKFKSISNLAIDMAYELVVNDDGTLAGIWAFGAYKDITGYTTSEFLERVSLIDAIHPDDLPIVQKRMDKLLNGETDHSEFRIKHKEGHYLWVEDKAAPVYDALEKRVIKIHGFAREISNLKHYIKRLENTQNELGKAYELIKHSNEVAKIGSWEIDLNTNKVYWSEVTKDILEVPQDYMPSLEEAINFYLPGKDRENIKSVIEMVIKEGQGYDEEQQIITANKKLKWVRAIGIPRTERNKVKRVYGLLQDIDENKRVQIEIEKLSMVASKVHNSVIITDAKGRVDWVNDAFYTLTGYTLEEIKGRTLGKVLQGKDTNPEDKEKIKQWLKRKEPFTQEILNYTKTGKPYWNELSVTPIFNEDGVLTQYFGIQNNITERKQSEAEIQKLSLVASNTQNGVVITDTNGCSVWVNDSFLSLSGYSKKEVLGKKPGELLQGPDTDPQHVQKIRSGLADRKPFTQEILNYNKKNEPYWIELSINPIFDKKGNLIQFIGIQNDISDRKKKEHELGKALEEKNTLFKELHHRVKNNLNMVSNLLYLKSNNTNDYRLIEFIKETTNRISSISKTHDQLLNLEEINQLFIKDYVQGLVENLVYSYAHDTKRYQVEYSIEDMELHVDKVLTIGLLTNEIILNTIKHAYSAEQTGVIYIDIRRKYDQVIYTIGDKGKGIKEEQLDFNNSLGLQLIKMFVLQLEGELELDTANGVQYCIKFPFR